MLNNKFDLKNKVFILTGSTSGIGYATSVLLYEMGCKIYVIGRNLKKLDELNYLGKGNIIPIKVDLMDNGSISYIVSQVDEMIDGFIHSAGVFKSAPLNFINKEFLDLERKLNYDVFLFLIKELVRNKKLKKKSSIVAISSI